MKKNPNLNYYAIISKNYKNIFQTKNYNFKFFQQWVQFGRHVIKEVIDQLLFLKLKKKTPTSNNIAKINKNYKNLFQTDNCNWLLTMGLNLEHL